MNTPRVDLVARPLDQFIGDSDGYVTAAFARQLETELAAAKERLAEIEKAAELPYDDRQVISSIGNDGSIEYVAAYAELRTHALHLAAENARLRDAMSKRNTNEAV